MSIPESLLHSPFSKREMNRHKEEIFSGHVTPVLPSKIGKRDEASKNIQQQLARKPDEVNAELARAIAARNSGLNREQFFAKEEQRARRIQRATERANDAATRNANSKKEPISTPTSKELDDLVAAIEGDSKRKHSDRFSARPAKPISKKAAKIEQASPSPASQ